MSLQPMLKQVKKSLTNKVYSLRKIRKYINDRAAISIYKQTILPIIDYSGFLLLSCSHGDQCALKKVQNDVLRICYKSRLPDKVKISELHKKARILSLEQRTIRQLLWLMYIFSLDNNNRKIVPRNLHSNEKYIFKTDSKIGTKYQNSPYYKGTVFWNNLPKNLQFADTVGCFKQLLRSRYKVYENLL